MTEEELLKVIERAATEGWTELDLSGRELTVLPPEIGNLTQLKKLVIGKYECDKDGGILSFSGNKLSALPPEIGSLIQLEELQIFANQLTSLPIEIKKLTNLKFLNLGSNQLSSLPAEFGQLVNLQTLNLQYNQLSILPAEFGQLVNLQTLDFSGNQLSSFPAEFGQLVNLQTLDLSSNQLSSLPAEIVQLVNLQILDLDSNQLSMFTVEIFQVINLQKLYLRSNQLSSLPAEIGQLTNLQTLDLYNNQLSGLPVEIGQLTNLQTLSLYNNQLSSLPVEIRQLTKLQILNLQYNQLSSLPVGIGQLTNLQILYLGSNQLISLPVEIGQLNNLEILDLRYNQLSSLPVEIGQLTNLQTLYLQNNQLSSLPVEIGHLHLCLTEFRLDGNHLESLPPEILGRESKAILNFYKQKLEQKTDYLYEAKFLIIGEGGAGKTSLAKKIEDENYELKSDEKSTEGIDVIQWKFSLDNGKEFRVNIWDFGGQEIYHQTHQFFLTKRSLYALVADSRREDTNFYWWIKVAELLSDKSPILIIKNEKQERQCNVNERQLRAEFLNLKEVLATNLATNRGLAEIKKNIKKYISNLTHVGENSALPKIWVKIRSDLDNDSRNYISLYEYYQICKNYKLTDRKDILTLSSYLHDLGVCLHFQDDPTLKHYVILKPEWGTAAVYKVLDNKTVKQNLGCFTQDDLADIWKDSKYADMRDELLQLMIRFKLCYQIPNSRGNYIAPQLLDSNEPEYTWKSSNNLILRYRYEFMPKGIITRFIVETHPWIEQQKLVWRSGVVLNKDKTRAEVIENYNKREIKVRVSGNRKKELLAVVNHELEKIHRSFERLKYQTLIPCNCQECAGIEDPYTYPLENLRKGLTKNIHQKIQCGNSFEMVEIRRLIEDVNLSSQAEYRESQVQSTQMQGELDHQKTKSLNNPKGKNMMNRSSEMEFENEIFISYKRGGESEGYVNRLDETLQEKGIKIFRDTRDIPYKGSIQGFMERIGRGKCVITVISEGYLKSRYCMFELVQIAKNKDFYNRIFPIVLADANIYEPIEILKYIKHWEYKIKELDDAMKDVGAANLQGIREEIDQYTDIRNTIAQLTNILNSMNALNPETHQQSGFEELIKAIEKRLNQDTISFDKESKPSTTSGTFETRRIEILKLDLEKLNKDYEAVADKKRRESNPVEKRNLQLQLDSIFQEIEEIEGQL